MSGAMYYDDCVCGERFHESLMPEHWLHMSPLVERIARAKILLGRARLEIRDPRMDGSHVTNTRTLLDEMRDVLRWSSNADGTPERSSTSP